MPIQEIPRWQEYQLWHLPVKGKPNPNQVILEPSFSLFFFRMFVLAAKLVLILDLTSSLSGIHGGLAELSLI